MNKFFLAFIAGIAFAACVPQPFSDDSELRLTPSQKTAPDSTPLAQEESFIGKEEARLAPLPSLSNDHQYYVRLLDLQTLLVPSDMRQLQDLLKEKTVLNRAILVLAGLRFYLHAGVDSSLFETEELANRTVTNAPNWLKFESLETLAITFDMSFADEIATNPFLSHPLPVDLALRALEKGNENLSYAMTIHKAIDEKRPVWGRFQERLLAFQKWHEGALNVAQAQSDAPSTSPSLPVFMEELRSGEDVLKKAQDYIDQSKFQDAITLLKTIDATSLHHSAAEEKVKEAANRAVAELRQKAARAFQSAIPVTDSKARTAYLQDARKFLLLALKLYPEADQLDTVKQNLNVITKNLELLNSGPGGVSSE